MRVDPRALAADALSALGGIERRIVAYDQDRFLADDDMRFIVERLYNMLGEALNALSKALPAASAKISALPTIVSFRNILVHRYRHINPEIVFAVAKNETESLIAILESLMAELEGA
ncbi:MAG TPA: hypothetical protein DEA40_14850 [Parvularcula sp.]|nr:hypothetical protein [Parvularcula sp.]HBS35176.1 hypothetical protein [Parvularcula sp.]